MSSQKRYMAGSIPRFLRQTKLGYLPLNCLLGSRIQRGNEGVNLIYDFVMLTIPEFQRVKSNIGLQHVLAPALKIDTTFSPGFVITDAKTCIVQLKETDPEGYARSYFLMQFGLIGPEAPKDNITGKSDFARAAKK